MTGPIFDTHAHYSARAFDAARFALLDSLPGKGVVGVCEQATHSGDAPKVLELAHKYPWVYAAVGIHPERLQAPEDCGEEGPAPTVSVYGGDWAAEMRALAPYYEDPKVVAVLAAVNGEKSTFLAVCGKEAVARGIKAGDLVRHVSAICGGKGGGKPDSAMGGGSDPLKVDDALAPVDDFVSEKLG